jgi:hypothetical protein
MRGLQGEVANELTGCADVQARLAPHRRALIPFVVTLYVGLEVVVLIVL